MKMHLREKPKVLAEKHMQAWAKTEEITDKRLSTHDLSDSGKKLGPAVTISREHGAGGSLIAELVGQKLGWEVLDRCLLDQVAQRYHLSRPMLELVDETKSNWVHDVLGAWLDSHVIPHEKYLTHLRQVVLTAAGRGHVVFVGRGAQFLLPRKHCIAMRIIAPMSYRIAQVARERGVSEKEAHRIIKEVDHNRAAFVARCFHRDINDPHLYDLVVNVEQHGPVAAAEAIVKICADL
jgi:hypothetical protein